MNELELKLAYLGYLVLDTKLCNNNSDDLLAPLLLSYKSLGYKLDQNSYEVLRKVNEETLKDFYFKSFKLLKKTKGNDVNRLVFYKNFPDLENMTEFDYTIRAILHYLTADTIDMGYMANEIKDFNREIEEYSNLTEVKIISKMEAIKLLAKFFTNLLEGKKIISEKDKELLEIFMEKHGELINPKTMPIKINMATYLKTWLKINGNDKKLGDALSILRFDFIDTATDLLRFYAVISDGDPALDSCFKFKSVDRSARRIILSQLERIAKNNPYIIDDIVMHEKLWKKAFELLHVGEFKNKYPNAYQIAYKLRSNNYQTYNGMLNLYLLKGDDNNLFKLLKVKPGVFARKLDMLLRSDKFSSDTVLSHFKEIAKNISTKVLISLWEFYQNRNNLSDLRSLMYRKGFTYNAFGIQETREVLEPIIIQKVIEIIEQSLTDKYRSNELIEGVYLSDAMKNYMLPTNNRNQVTGFKTLTFASKVKIDNPNNDQVLRMFTHWKNSDHRIDIDLSVELFDDKFNYVKTVGWHNMRAGDKYILHSGDIVSAPNGASEFVDINLAYAKNIARYALICNSVFTCEAFADIPECFSGVMLRSSFGKKGEIFDPKTVHMKFDLTQKESNSNLALAIDLDTLELIWLDIPQMSYHACVVAANNLDLCYPLKKALEKHMSIYDLVKLHSLHLNFVDRKEDAKFIIDVEGDLTPFMLDELAGKWL